MIITTRKARRALKHSDELIGPLYKTPKGWAFDIWHAKLQKCILAEDQMGYNEARKCRSGHRMARVSADYDIDYTALCWECNIGGRPESILARASRSTAEESRLRLLDFKKAA